MIKRQFSYKDSWESNACVFCSITSINICCNCLLNIYHYLILNGISLIFRNVNRLQKLPNFLMNKWDSVRGRAKLENKHFGQDLCIKFFSFKRAIHAKVCLTVLLVQVACTGEEICTVLSHTHMLLIIFFSQFYNSVKCQWVATFNDSFLLFLNTFAQPTIADMLFLWIFLILSIYF